MKLTVLIFIFNLTAFTSGCSSDDNDPEPSCFQDEGRRIVATITDAEGTIRAPGIFCPNDFTIGPDDQTDDRPLGSFFPCNLDDGLQIEDARVIFSGYVYESFDTEDICADFFEITSIRLINQ
ncbi:hypothetical protein [Flagellimonas algicola]|uniref:Lipoprotein n=1 Tax=Flagellimonas algicola TaxID=2583815 RepID=A0ABY2WR31_9FLAO|nr:hypothetical protein [Allomuricauda algicola]TMU57450.1 hypothetical protein FGG15_07875 [Allomuricauda algicola]